jgi:hypothetical protein
MGQIGSDAGGQGRLHTADSDSTNAALAAAVDMRTKHVNLTVEVPKDGYYQTIRRANPGMDPETAHKLASMTKRGMKASDLKSGNKDILSIGDHLILPDAPYPTPTSGATRDASAGSPEDKADQASKLQFPDDKDSHYRALARQELLAETGGTKLTPEETADLASKRQFPDAADSHYRELARKGLLSETGGMKLTPEETADLASKGQFPSAADSHYRELARRELLTETGGTKLTTEETADLASKRQFPDAVDSRYRELARKELLGETGGTKLTPDESADLQGRRRQARHDGFTPTSGMEQVYPSHRTESILNGTDWTAR